VTAPDPVDPPAPDPVDPPARGRTMEFRKRRGPPMSADQSRRQSDLVASAWRHFREAAPTIAFLNTRNDALDAPPLQLAIESDEGLARVETLLKQMSARS
jgi:hypothetical protein